MTELFVLVVRTLQRSLVLRIWAGSKLKLLNVMKNHATSGAAWEWHRVRLHHQAAERRNQKAGLHMASAEIPCAQYRSWLQGTSLNLFVAGSAEIGGQTNARSAQISTRLLTQKNARSCASNLQIARYHMAITAFLRICLIQTIYTSDSLKYKLSSTVACAKCVFACSLLIEPLSTFLWY